MNEHFSYLLQRFLNKQISEAELHDLSALLLENEDNEAFIVSVEAQIRQTGSTGTLDREDFNKVHETASNDRTVNGIIEAIFSADRQNQSATPIADLKSAADTLNPTHPSSDSIPVYPVHFLKTARFRYAAAVLLVLGIGAYLWTIHKKVNHPATMAAKPVEIVPGRDGAILTLADGTQVILDSLGNGVVATQNGTRVRLADGQLLYDPSVTGAGEAVYNTMTTPKGRQFQVMLPDGTKVWLNAASSIKYPTAFTGRERAIEITGEAYLEVARRAEQPFFVKIGNRAGVQVLGTGFNVNAYDDEGSINTTLVEGSIKIIPSTNATPSTPGIILRPGQQVQITNSQSSVFKNPIINNNVDIEKILAWKNGVFNFNGATLVEVMRQLERWYDIKVVYEGAIPRVQFFGEISRNENLSSLLKALEESKVHYRMEEGRRLVVLP